MGYYLKASVKSRHFIDIPWLKKRLRQKSKVSARNEADIMFDFLLTTWLKPNERLLYGDRRRLSSSSDDGEFLFDFLYRPVSLY